MFFLIQGQTLTHIMNSFCEHPEYVEPIREEMDQQPEMNFSVLESLPLLNSFIKEVIRTKPLDSGEICLVQTHIFSNANMADFQASTRRKALTAHTFKDGPHVPAGNLVCIPSYGIMHDARLYPNPQIFDGFRFAAHPTSDNQEHINEKEGRTKTSRVTDVDLSFPFWGYGKEAWYV